MNTQAIQQDTAKMLQAQLASMYAIQSMQDYLKYLILTTSIADSQKTQVKEEVNEIQATKSTESTPSIGSPAKPMSPSRDETKVSSPMIDGSMDSPKLESFNCYSSYNKKSHKLWNLLVKKYSNKKIKLADKKNVTKIEDDEDESIEEGETYRNFNGVYIPVLKNQVSHVRRTNICGHPERDHYARGLCGSCYHRTGRDKKPWNCSHDRLYALGLCHKCYTAKNRQVKKEKQQNMSPISNNDNNAMVIETKIEEEIKIKQECC